MSYSLDIPVDLMQDMRDTAKDANISAARAFGFGGSTWDYAIPSGQGTGPRTLTSVGTVQALAFRQKSGGLASAAGGTPILADVWRLIVLQGNPRPGAVIRSQLDPRYAFGIGTIEPWYEYKRCELERLRGSITIIGDTQDLLLDDAGQPLLDDE